MNKISIFDFFDYKSFLNAHVGPKTQRQGVKSAIAKALRCQPTFVSQVLNNRAHFSLEQAEGISHFLGQTEEEKTYFLLMIQKDRAGTRSLEQFFKNKMDQILTKRLVLTERLGKVQEHLSEEQKSIYYSTWVYAAIHMALTVPELQDVNRLSDFFQLPQPKISEAIEFLTSCGLVAMDGARYKTIWAQIRIGNQSHHILKHHTNWRVKAIDSLVYETAGDFHYSAVVSLSQADAIKIKDKILEELEQTLKIVDHSKEEKLFCYNVDLFDLAKGR